MNKCTRCEQTVRPVASDGLCDRCAHESLMQMREAAEGVAMSNNREYAEGVRLYLAATSGGEGNATNFTKSQVEKFVDGSSPPLGGALASEWIEQNAEIERLRAKLDDHIRTHHTAAWQNE